MHILKQRRSDGLQLLVGILVAGLVAGAIWGVGVWFHSTAQELAEASVVKISPAHAAWKYVAPQAVSQPSACVPSAIDVEVGAVEGAMQRVQIPVKVSNRDDTDCLFDTSTLTVSPSTSDASVDTADASGPVVLPADSSRTIAYSTAAICKGVIVETSKDVSAEVAVDGDNEAVAMVPSAISQCPELQATVVDGESAQDSGTGSFSSIRAEIELPARPLQDDGFHYIVKLRNVSESSPFAFETCPTITQSIHYLEGDAQISSELNCTSGAKILPGASADFEMIAPSQKSGSDLVAIAWAILDGPSASARFSS